MSAAQALASGLLAASPSVRSSSAAPAAERSDTSFRDTLDEASRSSEAPEREARPSPERTRESKDASNEEAADGDRDDDGRDGERTQPARVETIGAAELSAILAQLSGGSGEEGRAFVLPAKTAVSAAGSGEGDAEAGPVLPTEIADDGAPLDAEKLLALLKTGGATSSAPDAGVNRVDIKVAVAGQETHLALAPAPTQAVAALSVPQDPANGAPAAAAEGEARAAALGAQLTQATNEAAKSPRTRDGGAGVEREAKADARGVVRVGTIGEQWSQRGGAAVADQGIGGQDGRQSEGRGSSGGGSQSQGPATFMSMLAGASQAAGGVRDTVDAGFDAEPVSDQIAAHVRAELKADGVGETSSDGVVKVLTIELKPANLGSMTVRIALKDNAVTVHLEAQRHETLAVIEREREALAGALKAAGYAVDGITAAPQGEASRSLGSLLSGADSGSAATQSGPAGQADQGQGLGNSAGGQGRFTHAGSGHSGRQVSPDAKDTNAGAVRRSAEGLYV